MNPNDNHVLATPCSRTITCSKVCEFFQYTCLLINHDEYH